MNFQTGKFQKGQKLVVASHNQGKVREINALIEPFGLTALSVAELGLPEPVEDGETFQANALIKAKAAAAASCLPALADDSGLEVHGLEGAPGIYSARWAGADGDFYPAMQRVIDELAAKGLTSAETRTANFTCALALVFPDGPSEVYEGQVFGELVWPARGNLGFGYDPFFVPKGYDVTFGEMDPAHKHQISHRAAAFRLFKAACFD